VVVVVQQQASIRLGFYQQPSFLLAISGMFIINSLTSL
jgi:hypothetical protein